MPRGATAAPAKKPVRKAPRAYKVADPLPAGEILKDLNKKEWKLGHSLGQGGFGLIYLANEASSGAVKSDARYVVKIEPKDNGPLFVEQAFYQRAAKPDMVNDWRSSHGLAHLGVPKFIGCGMHTRGTKELRFLVMERFGDDIWKMFLRCKREFSAKTAFTMGLQILDSLEYLHDNGYAHADIKSANILTGYGTKAQNKVFLVDYGLASRFSPGGEHKAYKPDPKRAHDGTPEFTSIDAHKGVIPSRRGDLEILGYVMVQWMCSRLPWEDSISPSGTNFAQVFSLKQRYMSNIGSFMKVCFPNGHHPAELQKYLEYVIKLKYDEQPDYRKLKGLLTKGIHQTGAKVNGTLDFSPAKGRVSSKLNRGAKNYSRSDEDDGVASPRPARKTPSSKRPKPQAINDPSPKHRATPSTAVRHSSRLE